MTGKEGPMEIEGNPVIREMLDDLRREYPTLWQLVEQWLEEPCCLQLIHFLASSPHHWLAFSDLVAYTGYIGHEDEVKRSLSCLLRQGIVVSLEIPVAKEIFYRLTDREPEKQIIATFQEWCLHWRKRLEAAGHVLGVGDHWGEKRQSRA